MRIGKALYNLIIVFFRFGRKFTLLMGAIPILIGWLTIAFATNVSALFFGRLFFGFSYGLTFTALPVYLGEIASDRIRGFLSALPSAVTKSGFMFVFSLAPFISIKLMAFIAIVPVCLFVLTFMWLPESPYYFLGRNNRSEAKNSLQRLRRSTDVEVELDMMEVIVRKSEDNQGTWSEILSVDNRKGLLAALGIAAIIPMSGSSAITDYSQMIFEKINSNMDAVEASIILAAVQLIAAVLGNCVVDVIGRKPLLLFSSMSMGICTSVVTIYFYMDRNGYDVSDLGWIPITVLMVFQIGFNVGLATVAFTLMAELFPKNLKSIVNAMYMVAGSMMDVLVSKLFQTVSDSFGSDLPFAVFSVSSFLFVVFIVFVIPETKGKRFDVILVDMGAKKYMTKEKEFKV